MGISRKLKATQTQNELPPARPANACAGKNCTGIYVVRRVFLREENGVREVCRYAICPKCGRVKSRLCEDGVRRTLFWAEKPQGGQTLDELNFYVPRRFVCRAVFDSQGAPVLDAQGAQVTQYMPEMKRAFLRRLLGMVDFKSLCEQCFTAQEAAGEENGKSS